MEVETSKFVAVQSKFTSELDMSIPEHAEEMRRRVHGRDYRKTDKGEAIPQENTADFSIRNGFAHSDRLSQHLESVKKNEGEKAAHKEAKRIVALNSKYAPPLDRWLRPPHPEEIPKASDI